MMNNRGLREEYSSNLHDDLELLREEWNFTVALGHFCKGIPDQPGSLRLSRVTVDESILGSKDLPDAKDLHERVFRSHIHRFGRQATLLHWLALFTYEHSAPYGRRRPLEYASAVFKVGKANVPIALEKEESNRWVITLSRTFVDVLVPDNLVPDYLFALYQQLGEEEPKDALGSIWSWRDTLLLSARWNALTLAESESRSLTNLRVLSRVYEGVYDTESSDKASVPCEKVLLLQFLGALQLAFLYVRAFADPSDGFMSIGLLKRGKHRHQTETRFNSPVAVVSVPINGARKKLEEEIVAAISGGHLRSALETLGKPRDIVAVPNEFLAAGGGTGVGDIIDDLKKCVESAVPTPAVREWPSSAAPWLAVLLAMLRGTVHEGIGLDFTFVLGDVSQVRDSPHFELVSLSNCNLEIPPFEGSNYSRGKGHHDRVEAFAKEVKRQLAKENYCWFVGGRYALLWDITFPEASPQYLVRLKESSWRLFVAGCRDGQAPAVSREAMVVAYLQSDASGGIIVAGKHEFSLSRSGQWFRRGEGLKQRISAYLEEHGDILDHHNIAKLATALERIANDPHMGCMVILLEGTCAATLDLESFRSMGEPWGVGDAEEINAEGRDFTALRVSELVPLLGMDGAGCIWRDSDSQARIGVRRLVTAPREPSRKLARSTETYLRGEGSRKWSASLAACRGGVRLVIAVSQDGPVYIYAPAPSIGKRRDDLFKGLHQDEQVDPAGIVLVDVLESRGL